MDILNKNIKFLLFKRKKVKREKRAVNPASGSKESCSGLSIRAVLKIA